jgi:hypothetical protein
MKSFRDITQVESDLYDPQTPSNNRKRSDLSHKMASAPRTWSTGQSGPRPERKQRPVLLWFFLGSCAFAALMFVVMSFSLLGSGSAVSNQKIDIEILGKSFAQGGEELEFQVVVRNRNNAQLELADLSLEYPMSGDSDVRVSEDRRDLGTISATSERVELFDIKLFGAKDATVPITARLEYRVAGSKSIFVKETTFPVVLRSAPMDLQITGPDTIAKDQQLTYTITLSSQSQERLPQTALRVEYPVGFAPTKFSVEPDVGKNIWKLGDTLSGDSKTIEITGKLSGAVADQSLSLRAYVGQQSSTNERVIDTLYASESKQLLVTSSFLDTVLAVNGNSADSVAVSQGSNIAGTVVLRNVAGARVRDIEVTAHLEGGLYNPQTVRARGGFYDSNKNTITWTGTTGSPAQILDPNQSETLEFELEQSSQSTTPLVVKISIKGIAVDGSVYRVEDVDSITVRRAATVGISSSVVHRSGPLPAVVGQTTTYTATITINPPASSLSDVTVVTSIPNYVTWNNVVSPQQQSVRYTPANGGIAWNVGTVSSQSRSLSFDISVTPSITQTDEILSLIGDVSLSAFDNQSGATIQSTIAGLTTQKVAGDTSGGMVAGQ